MKKIRTIRQAVTEIKEADPNSAISEHALRRIVNAGKIPHIREGNKFLIDLDKVYEYYETY